MVMRKIMASDGLIRDQIKPVGSAIAPRWNGDWKASGARAIDKAMEATAATRCLNFSGKPTSDERRGRKTGAGGNADPTEMASTLLLAYKLVRSKTSPTAYVGTHDRMAMLHIQTTKRIIR